LISRYQNRSTKSTKLRLPRFEPTFLAQINLVPRRDCGSRELFAGRCPQRLRVRHGADPFGLHPQKLRVKPKLKTVCMSVIVIAFLTTAFDQNSQVCHKVLFSKIVTSARLITTIKVVDMMTFLSSTQMPKINRSIESVLAKTVEQCAGRTGNQPCPIIETLSQS
jgi:hypothetical protein